MQYERYRNWRYAASYSLLNYLQAAASMGLTFLLAQLLPVASFSDYRFGVTIVAIVSTAGFYGADKGLLIDLVHLQKQELTMTSYATVRSIIALPVALIIVIYIASTAEDQQRISISIVFSIVGIMMALRSPGWFEFNERLRQHALILLADRGLLALAVTGAVLLLPPDTIRVTWLGYITFFIVGTTLASEYLIITRHSGHLNFNRTHLVDEVNAILRRYSWVWLLALSNMLMTSFGHMILYMRGDTNELAYLGIALQFAAISRLFMQQLVRLRGASIAVRTAETYERRQLAHHMARSLLPVAVGGTLLFLIIPSFATVILTNFFEQQYTPAIPTVWVLSGWVIILGLGLNINRYIIGLGLQRIVFFISFAWGAIAIISTYFLSPTFGALGYSFILLICHGCSVLSQLVVFLYTGKQISG